MTSGEPTGSIAFRLTEFAVMVEELMRVADDLIAGGDEVNAFLVDQVVRTLLDRPFGPSD